MKRFAAEFCRRGLVACGFGPLVLAVLYWILGQKGIILTLTVEEVSLGIFSLAVLAFLVGGMNSIYQMERLPLMLAILIHGIVLYGAYLVTYLLNGWLDWGVIPILVFSGIFVFGYLLIWAVIYGINKRKTEKINAILLEKQKNV